MDHCFFMDSPVGKIRICGDLTGVTSLSFTDKSPEKETVMEETPLLLSAAKELAEYFSGKRFSFDFPLSLQGTDFQRRVWEALQTIPYGETRSYGQIARQIGNPKACRAVGMANHNNPIAIVVPCHRVVGQDGSLRGYACGTEIKKYLLRLEEGQRAHDK